MGTITPMMVLEELGGCSANVHEEATLSHPELLKDRLRYPKRNNVKTLI
jgi:hypothetical protein